jgi:hypothetical protein
VAVLRVIRPRTAPAFGRREAALIHRLMPHLSRALRLRQRLTIAAARHDDAAEVLDWFPTGVLLLDVSGRVMAANRVAEEILASADGLRAGCEGLRAALPVESAVLHRLIAEIGQGTVAIDPSGGVLNLTRPSGARPLNVLVAPLRGKLLSREAPRATVVFFVTDPERLPATPVDRVQRWLGLTRAEASLVLQLIQWLPRGGRCRRSRHLPPDGADPAQARAREDEHGPPGGADPSGARHPGGALALAIS